MSEEEPKKSFFIYEKPLFGFSESTYLMLMHLTQLAVWVVPLLGIVIPILLWAFQRDLNPLVNEQGKDIINFNISFIIYSIVLGISIVGIPLLIAIGALYLIFVIKATINAYEGKAYSPYPLTIQILK